MTDDRRVLPGPPNILLLRSPVVLSAPYQRGPVASRRTVYVHWLFLCHQTVRLLYTERSEKPRICAANVTEVLYRASAPAV